MKVHAVVVIAAIGKVDLDVIALGYPDRGPWYPAVVRPGGISDPRNELDLLVDRGNPILVLNLPAR